MPVASNLHSRHPRCYFGNNSFNLVIKVPWIASNFRNFVFFSLFILMVWVLWFWVKNRVETDYLLFHGLLNPHNSTLASAKNSNRDCQTVQLEKSRSTWTAVFSHYFSLENITKKWNIETIYKKEMKYKSYPNKSYQNYEGELLYQFQIGAKTDCTRIPLTPWYLLNHAL